MSLLPNFHSVPLVDFGSFTLGNIPKLFVDEKIKINEEYQRGYIWKHKQKAELINSITHSYSIGVLVLFVNDDGQYEILDGQQRLTTIRDYVNGSLDLSESGIPAYASLSLGDKARLDAYSIYYLQLIGQSPNTKEEDIVQTFLRLQEGTPLNKAEKINAYRGKFKDAFVDIRTNHPVFKMLGPDKRFRLRQLAAELLLIELESDFRTLTFPDIELDSLIDAAISYKDKIDIHKVAHVRTVLDFLYESLFFIVGSFRAREVYAFYMLASHLIHSSSNKAISADLFHAFAKGFLENMNSFSINDQTPPKGMPAAQFQTYKEFKQLSKELTTSRSLKKRIETMLSEYARITTAIQKDPKNLSQIADIRTFYTAQQGFCTECGKEIKFQGKKLEPVILTDSGGKILVHNRCEKKAARKTSL